MKTTALLATLALLAAQAASAASGASTSGSSALALASLVADHSPSLTPQEHEVMSDLLDGRLNFSFPPDRTIQVTADSVSCRASNVDITSHVCELTFGKKTVKLQGRQAHEVFATVLEAGVAPDAAAGTIFEALSQLACTINPGEIQQKAGGGANCKFVAEAP